MSLHSSAERKPFTVEDLFSLPDDGKRYEIYDGEVYMVPPPNLDHQHASKELQYLLTQHIKKHRLGELYNAPVALVLDPINYTEPDLIYVSQARRAVLTRRGIEGAPDLVVEIFSPSTKRRDLEVKLGMYQRANIPHYWLLDPIGKTLTALELQAEIYRETAQCGGNDLFEPALFAGLSIPMQDLWRRE